MLVSGVVMFGWASVGDSLLVRAGACEAHLQSSSQVRKAPGGVVDKNPSLVHSWTQKGRTAKQASAVE